MTRCRGCRGAAVAELIDFGPRPLSNRFRLRPDGEEPLYPLAIGQCAACGLVQLSSPLVPADDMRARYDWITYSEPEAHLDDVATEVASAAGLGDAPAVMGLTFKDDTLLRRLRERRSARTHRLDPAADLGVAHPFAGLETIGDRLGPEAAGRIAARRGRADLVIARHVFEHVDDPHRTLAALGELVRPAGHLMIEVPDCTRALTHGDVTTVWEEHSMYFTPRTLDDLLAGAGFRVVASMRVAHPLDALLIRLVRAAAPARADHVAAPAEIDRGHAFRDGVLRARRTVPAALAAHRARGGHVAVFGAGHLGWAFVDLLEIREHVEFFIDDLVRKRGLFMPGSGAPIRSSADLLDGRVSLCLLALSPDAEPAVLERNRTYLAAGGAFASIFPGAERAPGSPVRSFASVFAGGG